MRETTRMVRDHKRKTCQRIELLLKPIEDGINDFGRQIERINDRLYYGNQTQE